jgi:hypothetical protein
MDEDETVLLEWQDPADLHRAAPFRPEPTLLIGDVCPRPTPQVAREAESGHRRAPEVSEEPDD